MVTVRLPVLKPAPPTVTDVARPYVVDDGDKTIAIALNVVVAVGFVPSLAVTVRSPPTVGGAVNEQPALMTPLAFEAHVAIVTTPEPVSKLTVIVLLAPKELPDTPTLSPTWPLFGVNVIEGTVTVNVCESF
jgi:hypothetical protein